jgi:hypothetical protein
VKEVLLEVLDLGASRVCLAHQERMVHLEKMGQQECKDHQE